MNYGLYLASSGMLVNMYRMDVIGNNLANVNTAGFMPDQASFRWREPQRVEAGLSDIGPQRLLERLGGGVHLNPNITRFRAGQLSETGNPLDVALDGPGFFTFASGRGEGNERFRFSRDGRFAINDDGYLVHAASGMRLLDEMDQPIRLRSDSRMSIRPDGWVVEDEAPLARLGVSTPPDPQALRKAGGNMFMMDATAQRSRVRAPALLKQGWLEGSAVDAMQMMMELASANGAISAGARMIQFHDELMNSAINRLGRVA